MHTSADADTHPPDEVQTPPAAKRSGPPRWFFKAYRFFKRHQRWLPLISFIAGVSSFIFVDRQKELATWILLFLLLTWLLFEGETALSQLVKRFWGRALPEFVISFTAQNLHQETLFFVIPFLFFHTAWNTIHAVFTTFVILLACISVLDDVYFPLIQRRWARALIHGFVSFLVIFVSLPQIMQLTTTTSLTIACITMVLITAPSLYRSVNGHWSKRLTLALTLAPSIGLLMWLARPIIPPTSFRVQELFPTVAVDVTQRQAKAIDGETLTAAQLGGGLYVFSAIRAPRGVHEAVYHHWYWNGKLMDRVRLEIVGGREAGFRSWSHKQHFPAEPYGTWQVVVTTSARQHLGSTRFTIVPGNLADTADTTDTADTDQPHVDQPVDASGAATEPPTEQAEEQADTTNTQPAHADAAQPAQPNPHSQDSRARAATPNTKGAAAQQPAVKQAEETSTTPSAQPPQDPAQPPKQNQDPAPENAAASGNQTATSGGTDL